MNTTQIYFDGGLMPCSRGCDEIIKRPYSVRQKTLFPSREEGHNDVIMMAKDRPNVDVFAF